MQADRAFLFMSVTYPQTEPISFRAGTTVVWQKGDFPNFNRAEGYTTAKYTLSGNNGSATIEGSWSAADSIWTFTIPSTTELTAGTYTLFGYVQTSGGDTQPVHESTVEVKRSLTTATQVDTRSSWKIILDAAKAVLQKRATREQAMTQTPEGVTISLLKPAELVDLIRTAEYEYEREKDAERVSNGRSRRRIVATFLPTS